MRAACTCHPDWASACAQDRITSRRHSRNACLGFELSLFADVSLGVLNLLYRGKVKRSCYVSGSFGVRRHVHSRDDTYLDLSPLRLTGETFLSLTSPLCLARSSPSLSSHPPLASSRGRTSVHRVTAASRSWLAVAGKSSERCVACAVPLLGAQAKLAADKQEKGKLI